MALTTAPLMSDQLRGFGDASTATPHPCSRPGVFPLQLRLVTQGHDPGPIDGVFGGRTMQAMQAFQRAQRLGVSAQPNEETLSALGITIAVGTTIQHCLESEQCLARSMSGAHSPGGTTGPRVDDVEDAPDAGAMARRLVAAADRVPWYGWVGAAAVAAGAVAFASGALGKRKRGRRG